MNYQYYFAHNALYDDYTATDVQVHVNGTGYYHGFSNNKPTVRRNRYWRLQIMEHSPETDPELEILKSGQFVVREADVPYTFTEGMGIVTSYYWAHFSGNHISELLANSCLVPNKIYSLQEPQMQLLRKEFDELFREFILRQTGYEEMTASIFVGILVRLGRFVQDSTPEAHEVRLRSQLAQSAVYINNHYTEDIAVTKLAEMECLSARQYRDVFRAAFGTSPSNYITELRITNAQKLLRETNLSVNQIAKDCGYEDPLYFSRLFRKKTGMPPLAYRKSEKTV